MDSVEIRHLVKNNLVSYSKGHYLVESKIKFIGSLLFYLNGYESKTLSERDVNIVLNNNRDTTIVSLIPINNLTDEVVVTANQNQMSMGFGNIY